MLGKRFEDALTYAAELHRDHVRKGTDRNAAGEPVPPTPYLAHLLGVASLALDAGADEQEAIAALLHDALEDRPRGGNTARDILELFGPDVLAIVEGCTKVEVEPDLAGDARQARRREIRKAYFEHLRHADASVLLVSAADKLHNARAIVADLEELGPSALDRFNDDREGTLWYYRGVLDALRDAGAPRRLVRPLAVAVAEMHRLAGAARTHGSGGPEAP
jgi:GTP pyrophosphokinase